ncbi:NAD(P)/FAD-dependent oxidoreductase [Adhaeribacter aquaticus]|uniref:NAD(P)/FAD-dependent oxidoreductase n=1 Tax=Adhaeribacter aquaticus TaxID=299567 RepID=UPI00041D2B91|nr:NAD(P)/FAD-dependent oxidoreductase [Adhaeribacter aquaticus]
MSGRKEKIVVIGGGAAGFFAAITCAQNNPEVEVILLEKTTKLLSKVKISGGGRCNVTHALFNPNQFIHFYPRGGKFLKSCFKIFGATETVAWFEKRGVKLKAEPDGRMFPVTDNSETIVNCLIQEARKTGVIIKTGVGVEAIVKSNAGNAFSLHLTSGDTILAAKVLVSTGGNPKSQNYQWLSNLGHTILAPAPSLFTFNVPNSPLKELPGISVANARVKIAGQPLENEGPLLITHWGFSGPAILKLSAWGARLLQDINYHFTALINWIPDYTEETLRAFLTDYRKQYPKRLVVSNPIFGLPQRLWKVLNAISEIPDQTVWAELPAKNQNKLVESLIRAPFEVKGKTTFKDEFVTCGGIALPEINAATMESKLIPNLFFAGEVLDIDGVTGGFNFQAAWTTGYLAGKAMAG